MDRLEQYINITFLAQFLNVMTPSDLEAYRSVCNKARIGAPLSAQDCQVLKDIVSKFEGAPNASNS